MAAVQMASQPPPPTTLTTPEKAPTSPSDQGGVVPLRQFSLYRPPYEELYTFWWKCMQITLHDKGTQTSEQVSQTEPETAVVSAPIELQMDQSKPHTESDQLKQLMAMVNFYNNSGRDSEYTDIPTATEIQHMTSYTL
eukprot:sb/3474446/